jgi:hypothetical protein
LQKKGQWHHPEERSDTSYGSSGHGFTGCGKKLTQQHSEERSDDDLLRFVRARFQPCHECRGISTASAAEVRFFRFAIVIMTSRVPDPDFFRSLFNRAVRAAKSTRL